MNQKVKSSIYLLLCAIIWGSAFVAQRAGMENIPPFYFSAFRMLIGAFALIPISMVTERGLERDRRKKNIPLPTPEEREKTKKLLMKGGILCGVVIFLAGNFQQVGLVSTSAGKTAFITTLYILLVPLLGLVLRHKTNVFHWIGVVVGTVGLYFLCITNQLTIAPGDLVVLIGAFFWAVHILCMDYYAPQVNVAKLVSIQFFVAGFLSLGTALMIEEFTTDGFFLALPGIVYVGIMSTAIAFTLQALGQKKSNPTVASIILSTESLFGALSGYFLLEEVLTKRELLGCTLMFAAIIIAQLPTKEERLQNRKEKENV